MIQTEKKSDDQTNLEPEKSEEYLRFESFAKKIFAVPKAELDELQAKEKKARKKKPRKTN